jgi:CubicO group peptidase (beta-lactamase class C family)
MEFTLERVNPASVGLSGNAILNYIENLQTNSTDMHGIMIARHGKVCAEGWWKPFSPGLIHGLQSLTKSYVATAMGILVSEGRASLAEKIVDILPEFMPNKKSENLKAITIHHLLCMGAGNNSMQDRTNRSWLQDFFASDFPYAPGSHFYYSGVVTSVIGAIVRQKTSEGLMEFLKKRLFDKIGINAERLKWIELPDGMEYGGGGLFATTEDNLRLGQLYLNDGEWQGERILSKEWVKAATSKQIDINQYPESDKCMGYGYQIWMCQPPGVYRFSGAHGQSVVIVPNMDMVIAINQFANGQLIQETLNLTWQYLTKAQGSDSGDLKLSAVLPSLSLPRVNYGNVPQCDRFTKDRTFRFDQNDVDLFPCSYPTFSFKVPRGIEQISFTEEKGEVIAIIQCNKHLFNLHVSLDGVERLSILHAADDLPDMVYASGVWENDDTLNITLRYLETCFTVTYVIKRQGQGIQLTTSRWQPPDTKSVEYIKICSI